MFIFYEAIKFERYDCNSLCLLAELCTHTWAGPGHSGTSCCSYLCAHIKGFVRSKKTIHLRLEKPCQCKQNSYQFEKNLGFFTSYCSFPIKSTEMKHGKNRKRAKQKVGYYILSALLFNSEILFNLISPEIKKNKINNRKNPP